MTPTRDISPVQTDGPLSGFVLSLETWGALRVSPTHRPNYVEYFSSRLLQERIAANKVTSKSVASEATLSTSRHRNERKNVQTPPDSKDLKVMANPCFSRSENLPAEPVTPIRYLGLCVESVTRAYYEPIFSPDTSDSDSEPLPELAHSTIDTDLESTTAFRLPMPIRRGSQASSLSPDTKGSEFEGDKMPRGSDRDSDSPFLVSSPFRVSSVNSWGDSDSEDNTP